MKSDDLMVRKTVSLAPALLEAAARRMAALGIRKFSQYVALLLEKDEREGGPIIVVKEEAPNWRVRLK